LAQIEENETGNSFAGLRSVTGFENPRLNELVRAGWKRTQYKFRTSEVVKATGVIAQNFQSEGSLAGKNMICFDARSWNRGFDFDVIGNRPIRPMLIIRRTRLATRQECGQGGD